MLMFLVCFQTVVVITCPLVCRNCVVCCHSMSKMSTIVDHPIGWRCWSGFLMHLQAFLGCVLSIMASSLFSSFLQWASSFGSLGLATSCLLTFDYLPPPLSSMIQYGDRARNMVEENSSDFPLLQIC